MKYEKLRGAIQRASDKKYGPYLKSFRLHNFKAIEDSRVVRFTPLTVLIGNNGSGKSSLIEGLETYRTIVADGLDAAMSRWYDLGYIRNNRVGHDYIAGGIANETYTNPIRFEACGKVDVGSYRANMIVNAKPGMNGITIQEENIHAPDGTIYARDRSGACQIIRQNEASKLRRKYEAGESAMPGEVRRAITKWQFLSLLSGPMGQPMPKQMTTNGTVVLNRDGSNIAQYLLAIRTNNTDAFDGIVDAMRFVLDYAKNFEPVETRELLPTMYLKMLEQIRDHSIEIPSWLISTGTIRALALLAVLRNPDPPPLIVIEEIENGLDPRTIHMVLEEVRSVVQSGKSQVIMSTHSPYLLDLLPLQSLVLVQRENGGDPTFWRPSDSDDVMAWAKDFAPGQLYTAGRLFRGSKQ